MEQGDYDGAIRELEKIAADSPFAAEARRKLAHAHTSRAESYTKYGRFPSALAHLEAAERYDGGNAARRAEIRRLRETLAETNYEQGIRAMSSDLPLSAAYFRKAVDYNPQHTRARIQLQTVERMMKNLKKIDTDETGS
jgi:tetratricopeptide (TPR) repeat protein